MRYVFARSQQELRERAYRIYITESLFAYGDNKRLSTRYMDIIKPKTAEDTRTGDEIALDVIKRLELRMEE